MGKVIYFDGDCNFCDGFVHWVYKRDRRKVFQFSFNNKGAAEIYVEADNLIVRGSAAVSMILSELGLIPRIVSLFFRIPLLSTLAYSFFAKYRYVIFGKKDSCSVENFKRISDRLLDD